MEKNYLVHYKNYYVYAKSVQTGEQAVVYPERDITRETINDHIDGILSILKDGIETPYVHNMTIRLSWGGDAWCELSASDYLFNLIMWYMLVNLGITIRPKNIFWDDTMKKKDIKKFIDRFVLDNFIRRTVDNKLISSIICEGTYFFSYVEVFAYYLANTINNEDDIDLMNKCEEYDNYLHQKFSNVEFQDVKSKGMAMAKNAIEIIENSLEILGYEHGLMNSFRAGEAINPRQWKEVKINIGTKPNNEGGIYPYIIDTSFAAGGVNKPLWYLIESSTARIAQILSKTNVGDSGDFARLLGINNTDTILNQNEEYECMSSHFIEYEVKTENHVEVMNGRYFRNNPRGMEYMIDDNDKAQIKGLVGKKIYLKSPMTCSSHSSGMGICHRCYGELYYTNKDINPGKIAAEILSAMLTQRLLSAKHLLETNIVKIKWVEEFQIFFNVEINAITLNQNIDSWAGFKIIIDPDDVNEIDETETDDYDDEEDNAMIKLDDDVRYNEYLKKFILVTPEGDEIPIYSLTDDSMFISTDLNQFIRKHAHPLEDKMVIPLDKFDPENILFFIKINNNELSKTMNDIIGTINVKSKIAGKSMHEVMQELIDLSIEGGLHINAVHLETILSNQIVSNINILKKPNWNDPSVTYEMLTLDRALKYNPSIIVSLLYQNVDRVLYDPLSFSKSGPSFFDTFFQQCPQEYMSDEYLDTDVQIREPGKYVEMVRRVEK